MEVKEFIAKYKNHPVLFIGAGISKRYLKQSYSWEELLETMSFELTNNKEYFYDLKNKCYDIKTDKYDLPYLASLLEEKFNLQLESDRNGKFKYINDIFYEQMHQGKRLSRFKIYLSKLLESKELKTNMDLEIIELKKARKNIGSIISTNYDKFLEDLFKFTPLVGNDILFSNPYGSIYKIHGCIDKPQAIVMTKDDYSKFQKEYELIRAQLLSIFIHNPIMFLGYSLDDENIRKMLETIFSYIKPNSIEGEKIRSNFLLVEFDYGSSNLEVIEHDFTVNGITVKINKLKTDNYHYIYNSIEALQLPISAMDIRKVQNIVKDIYSGGEISVNITEDINTLENSEKVLVIGSKKTIKYEYRTIKEMVENYFDLIDEANIQLIELINKQKIQKNQYFPIFGFLNITHNIERKESIKLNMNEKIKNALNSISPQCQTIYTSTQKIIESENIAKTNKANCIFWNVYNKNIDLDDFELFLRNCTIKDSNFKKLLCLYDWMRYF